MSGKLLSARFLVTVSLTLTFCWLSIDGKISQDAFIPVLITVINFYFARKDRGNEKS